MTLFITKFSSMKLGEMVLSMAVRNDTLDKGTCLFNTSIMMLVISTLSIMTLSIMTLSIMTISLTSLGAIR